MKTTNERIIEFIILIVLLISYMVVLVLSQIPLNLIFSLGNTDTYIYANPMKQWDEAFIPITLDEGYYGVTSSNAFKTGSVCYEFDNEIRSADVYWDSRNNPTCLLEVSDDTEIELDFYESYGPMTLNIRKIEESDYNEYMAY